MKMTSKKFTNADGPLNMKLGYQFAQQEATLTRKLSVSLKVWSSFSTVPGLTPCQDWWNGLELTMKHMPGFNLLVKDERRIASATLKWLTLVLLDIGIEMSTVRTKAIQKGRMAMVPCYYGIYGFHERSSDW